MRRNTVIIVCMLLTLVAHSQIDLSGRTLVYDSRTKSYLCSVPDSLFDNGCVAAFTCDTATINFTFLPIIRIHGTCSDEYAVTTVDLFQPDSEDQLAMLARLKWRGGTSNTENTHKRNYHVKFLNADSTKQDRKFFGLRKDNSWLLNAAASDLSRVRNQSALDIWNEFSTRPYYADKEPKAITAPRGQFVELFLNDEYMGIYDMMEDTDRSLLKLKKYDNDKTIHGQLWKGKGYANTSMWGYSDYDNSSETWGGYETKYPDLDDVSPTDYSTLYNMVRFVCDANDGDFAACIDEYVDMPVLVDLFVYLYTLSAQDNYSGKNMFWACYDKQEDKKLVPLPWDMDCSVGRYYMPGGIVDSLLLPETHDDAFHGNGLFYRVDGKNVNGFHNMCETRWRELRQTCFTVENLQRHYTKYMDMLMKSGAFDREKARWNGDSDIFGQTLDFADERVFITDWLRRRIANIDTYGMPTSIANVTTGRMPDAAYNLQGLRVKKVTTPGVYIVDGRKYICR